VAPNKCQHDVIQLAYLYFKLTGVRAKVVLVGGFNFADYLNSVSLFTKSLSMTIGETFESDVVVLGSVSDSEMATLYRNSQAFVSMSEHEGFGVPLVESLWFNLPVIAHNSSAVGETLGDAGFLIDKSNWVGVVETLHQVITQGCSSELKHAMRKRREELSIQKTELALQHLIESYLVPLW
jgi:glycosyltransferase involved in cell wall biosynthesis